MRVVTAYWSSAGSDRPILLPVIDETIVGISPSAYRSGMNKCDAFEHYSYAKRTSNAQNASPLTFNGTQTFYNTSFCVALGKVG